MMDTDGTMEQERCEDDENKGYGTSNQTASQEESEQSTGKCRSRGQGRKHARSRDTTRRHAR